MTIIERVQTLLKEKGITARDMCRDIGLHEATYSAWKTRGTNPSADWISPIAHYLDVSVEFLLTGVQDEYFIHEREKRLLTYWALLNEVGKAQLLSSANAFSHVPEYCDEFRDD